ncbi:dynein axonemal intermediate chain 2-like [Augochlora pura]
METKKVYVKKRTEFGKQCVFAATEPSLDVDLRPNPADMRDYVKRYHCNATVQMSTQLAEHEVQTTTVPIQNTGMYHFEGGWPKDINPLDEETTSRFRRRVEKDDSWAPKLKKLFGVMEDGVLQNGAINIYQHYFDDMVPTELVQPVSLRAVASYTDRGHLKRPVTDISVSPDDGRRIAVSYCFLEFGRRTDYGNTVYIWQVDNSIEPYMALEPFCPCVACEFNPRDPSILISALMTGQVCCWDIRASTKPVQYSDPLFSHRTYANGVTWVPSKTNTEFFSTSLDGRAMWWDTRQLRRPTETLIFDLDKPNEPSMYKAIGVSSLNFGAMVGTKFMFGMDNGIVVTGSRKAKTNVEKLAAKFEAHFGPVVAVDRNVFNPSVFLSIGDWTVKVWDESTREGNLISTLYDNPTTGCWDKIRNSVFYVATDAGTLIALDLLQKIGKPIFRLQLCDSRITAIAPYEEGTFIALGNYNGTSILVESTEFLQRFTRKDRAALSEYLERCTKLTRAVDTRLKEIKLMQKITADEEEAAALHAAASAHKVKEKKKSKKGDEDHHHHHAGSKKDKERDRDSKQGKELKRKLKDFAITAQLTEAENKYFELVGQELLQYANVSETELRPVGPIFVAKKPDRKTKSHKEDRSAKKKVAARPSVLPSRKRTRAATRARSLKKASSSVPAFSSDEQVEQVESLVSAKMDRRGKKTKKQMVKFRLPIPCKKQVCKPQVCCFRHKRGSKKKKKEEEEEEQQTEVKTKTSQFDESSTSTSIRSTRKKRSLRGLIRWQMLNLPKELVQETKRARREIKESPSVRLSRVTAMAETAKEESRVKISESVRSRRTFESETHRESDASVKKEEISADTEETAEEDSPAREERKTRVKRDPCAVPKFPKISKQFEAMLNAPMPHSVEEAVAEEEDLVKELELKKDRTYPRISEFHVNN